jgi:hypothetical protein
MRISLGIAASSRRRVYVDGTSALAFERKRPRVRPALPDPLGLLHHHRRELAIAGAVGVASAQGVSDLVIDHVLAVAGEVAAVGGRAVRPALGLSTARPFWWHE